MDEYPPKPSLMPFIVSIIVLLIVIVGILVYFLQFHKPSEEKCSKLYPTSCPAPDCPSPDCHKNNIFGFSIKPGNEILDVANELEDEFKPLVHGIICSIISQVKTEILRGVPSGDLIKCSEIKIQIEKLIKEIESDQWIQNNTFLKKYKIYNTVKEKFQKLYDKLYDRFCENDETFITKTDIEKLLNEFQKHICEDTNEIDISFLKSYSNITDGIAS